MILINYRLNLLVLLIHKALLRLLLLLRWHLRPDWRIVTQYPLPVFLHGDLFLLYVLWHVAYKRVQRHVYRLHWFGGLRTQHLLLLELFSVYASGSCNVALKLLNLSRVFGNVLSNLISQWLEAQIAI